MPISKIERAGMPGGAVLQVVSARSTTQVNSSSTAWFDIGVSASITPSSANSKILAFYSVQSNSAGAVNGHGTRLLRDATVVNATGSNAASYRNITSTRGKQPYHYLDSPATTATITYKVQCGNYAASTIEYISDGDAAELLLMEIAA